MGWWVTAIFKDKAEEEPSAKLGTWCHGSQGGEYPELGMGQQCQEPQEVGALRKHHSSHAGYVAGLWPQNH